MVEMETLTRDECLRLLPGRGTGWVTCGAEHGRPALRPVDFVVHAGELVFRACYRDEVAGVLHDPVVAVGVCDLRAGDRAGWWVTVTGQARLVGDALVNPGLPEVDCWLEPGAGLLVGVPTADVRGYRIVPSVVRRPAPGPRRTIRGPSAPLRRRSVPAA